MKVLNNEIGGMRKIERAKEAVDGDGRRAEDFGQSPLPRPAEKVHLPEPVLRVDEACGKHEIVLVGRAEVGNAVAVANHIHRLVESRYAHRPFRLRKRLLDEVAEEENSGDQADNKEE